MIVDQIADAVGRAEMEHGHLGDKSAVGQAKQKVLGEIPHRVDAHGHPDASRIPTHEGIRDPADDDTDDREDGGAVVEYVEQPEEDAVYEHGHPQRIVDTDPFIQVAPAPEFLGRALDENHQQGVEEPGQHIDAEIQVQMDVAVQERAQYAEKVRKKPYQQTYEQISAGVFLGGLVGVLDHPDLMILSRPFGKKGSQNEPVFPDDQAHDQEYDDRAYRRRIKLVDERDPRRGVLAETVNEPIDSQLYKGRQKKV